MRKGRRGTVRIGCSGWNYKHWRGVVYPLGMPESGWLDHCATLFDTVEINTTFYRLPSISAVAGWVEHTPLPSSSGASTTAGGDGSYSHRRLAAWARRIEEWRCDGDVYVTTTGPGTRSRPVSG